MAGKSYLLDTNVIIDLFSGRKEIAEKLSEADFLFIPSIVVGELYYGAYNSGRKSNHLKQINNFLEMCKVLVVNNETALYYGEVKTQLKRKGTPIPENDVWIAALSLQHDVKVFTNDKHFSQVKGIKIFSY